MEVSGQLHTPASLPLGQIHQQTVNRAASEPGSSLVVMKRKILPLPGIETLPRLSLQEKKGEINDERKAEGRKK
jgi:hypothetical protein